MKPINNLYCLGEVFIYQVPNPFCTIVQDDSLLRQIRIPMYASTPQKGTEFFRFTNIRISGKEEATIFIPAMVLAEILYLSQKGRMQASLSAVSQLLQKYPNFKKYSLTFDVIRAAEKITDIPELHDRLIAATANLLGCPLITPEFLEFHRAFPGSGMVTLGVVVDIRKQR
ncbi:MAG: type II toxin-antitoxin system VapC family toxin [Chloroflexi bacterium]|nr:type II toxin-antitoxin system VapC family toxin [Chloroflexota bacterium]